MFGQKVLDLLLKTYLKLSLQVHLSTCRNYDDCTQARKWARNEIIGAYPHTDMHRCTLMQRIISTYPCIGAYTNTGVQIYTDTDVPICKYDSLTCTLIRTYRCCALTFFHILYAVSGLEYGICYRENAKMS